jgi:hypothetical protein
MTGRAIHGRFFPTRSGTWDTSRSRPTVEQVTRRIQQGFDLFFNLCDGAADQSTPGIEVGRAMVRRPVVNQVIK